MDILAMFSSKVLVILLIIFTVGIAIGMVSLGYTIFKHRKSGTLTNVVEEVTASKIFSKFIPKLNKSLFITWVAIISVMFISMLIAIIFELTK